MTVSRTQAILLAVAGLALAVTFFVAGRTCGVSPIERVVIEQRGIDAGPGERDIEARLDAALQAAVLTLEQIEDKFAEDIENFDGQQRAEYDRLRGGGDLEATARALSQWNQQRRSRDGGR